MLKGAFPDVRFENVLVYHTQQYKIRHVRDLVDYGKIENDFIMFDSDREILDNIKENYPESRSYWVKKNLNYSVFNQHVFDNNLIVSRPRNLLDIEPII